MPNVNEIIIPEGYLTDLWVPDIYFENGKNELFHEYPNLNKQLVIYPDGSIFQSKRYFSGMVRLSVSVSVLGKYRMVFKYRISEQKFSPDTDIFISI